MSLRCSSGSCRVSLGALTCCETGTRRAGVGQATELEAEEGQAIRGGMRAPELWTPHIGRSCGFMEIEKLWILSMHILVGMNTSPGILEVKILLILQMRKLRPGDIRGFAPGGLGAQPGCHLVPACLAPSVRCFPQGQMEEARAGPTDGDGHGLVLLQLGPERDRLCLRDGH